MVPFGGALGLVGLPAAAVGAPGPRALVELEHVGHGAVEEGPVVRDDHHPAATSLDHVLEAGEAVEVEVVRRLVEQRDVEAGEQDGGQRHPGLLPAREYGDPLVTDVGRKPHLLEGGDEPGLEIAGRGRLVAGQGRGVAVVGPGLDRGEIGRRSRQRLLGRGHTGPAQQGVAHRFVLRHRVLLAQVADGRRGRVDPDGPGDRLEQAGQELEQCGLADAVRADDTEARLGSDGQRHVVEHETAATFEAEVPRGEGGRWHSGEGRHGELRGW